jgi:adenosylcobinamide-GDP ribazoletransferase
VLISLINGHVSSRFIASTFVQSHEYVQDLDISKSRPIANSKLSIYEMSYSFLFTILPYFLFPSVLFLSIFVPAFLSKVYLGYYFHKHIGGYTGDCLGATQQVSEVVLYISILGIWKYI